MSDKSLRNRYEYSCICGYKVINLFNRKIWICPKCKKIWKVERYKQGNVFIYEYEN